MRRMFRSLSLTFALLFSVLVSVQEAAVASTSICRIHCANGSFARLYNITFEQCCQRIYMACGSEGGTATWESEEGLVLDC